MKFTVLASFLIVMLAPSAGSAIDRYGYATVAVGDAISDSIFNSTGKGVAIDKSESSRGIVTLRFRGLETVGTGGHVQASAAGPHVNYCKVVRWFSQPPDTVVRVACFEADGRPEEGAFRVNVLLLADVVGESRNLSFAWASRPTVSSYTPSRTFLFNGPNPPTTIRRLAVGRWQVRVPGMAERSGNFGNVQVSGYGSDNARCGLDSWLPIEGTNDLSVIVECFDPEEGQPQDARFTLLVVQPGGLNRFQKAWTRARNSRTPPLAVPRQFAHNSVPEGTVGVGSQDHRVFTPFGFGFPRPSIVFTTAVGAEPGGFCRTAEVIPRTKRTEAALVHELVYDPQCLSSNGSETSSGYSVLALTGETLPFSRRERSATLHFERVMAFPDGACGLQLFTRAELIGSTTDRIDTEGRRVHTAANVSNEVGHYWRPLRVELRPEVSRFPASLALRDDDWAFCGDEDDVIDINPIAGRFAKDLGLIIDLERRLVFTSGFALGRLGQSIRAAGDARDDSGSLTFRIVLDPPLED